MMELAGIELDGCATTDLSYNPDVDHSLLSRYASTADGWISYNSIRFAILFQCCTPVTPPDSLQFVHLPISRMPIVLITIFRFATRNVSRSDCRSVHVSVP